MKRLAIATIGVLLAAGCGSSSSSPSSSTTGAGTSTIRFTAALSPASEVPPITNAESTGRGTATVDFNITRDAANAITAASVNFQVNLTGLPSTAVVNIAHIHPGAAGVNGIVLTKLDGTAKGGVAVAIACDLQLPIRYVGVGEGIEDLVEFSADEYVDGLFEENW